MLPPWSLKAAQQLQLLRRARPAAPANPAACSLAILGRGTALILAWVRISVDYHRRSLWECQASGTSSRNSFSASRSWRETYWTLMPNQDQRPHHRRGPGVHNDISLPDLDVGSMLVVQASGD